MESTFEYSKPLKSVRNILDLYIEAISYRENHKHQSKQIARFVFYVVHFDRILFELLEELEILRYEFGALEAPGLGNDVHSGCS